MKKIIFLVLLPAIIIMNGCKKDNSTVIPVADKKCKLIREATNLPGNHAEFDYSYNSDGTLSSIKKYLTGNYHVLTDSMAIGSYSTEMYHGLDYKADLKIISTIYKPAFDQLPGVSNVSIEYPSQGITYVNNWSFIFLYDRNRLVKVSEHTENINGDGEYDLHIAYNDQDNVTSLSYEITTGPRIITTYTASGYDDKPNPYSRIPYWRFVKYAGWNSYEPDDIFTALSKNNPLGYTTPDGYKRVITYEYNADGFPTKKIHSNSTTSSTSPPTHFYDEEFTYQCQ